jgi:hypothetical protein
MTSKSTYHLTGMVFDVTGDLDEITILLVIDGRRQETLGG